MEQILSELVKLKGGQTRVFVVHMSYTLGLKLFTYAKEQDMMGQGYVWITTYGLTDIVDLLGSSASAVMQGVLGVRPYVRESKEFSDFKMRWQSKFYPMSNPDRKLSQPTVFGLWAYDTVWSLALATERAAVRNFTFQDRNSTGNSTDFSTLGSSLFGPVLLNQMLHTKTVGISGDFEIVKGQLESKAFEIINVAQHGKVTVGFWTLANGTSGDLFSQKELRQVIWPGGQMAAPKGWEWPTLGKVLQIGIPVKPGFPEFMQLKNKPYKGYCIEVFDAVMAQMPYNVHYNYVKYEDAYGNMNGSYDDLVYQVYLKNFDVVVGDVTITADRSQYVDFTLPYTESGVSMVVPVKDKRHKGAWTFLEPLSTDLWLASGAFFVFTGFVVWFIEHRINDEFRGNTSNQLGTIFYFAFSTLVFAHRERVLSNLSRIVVIIWVFVVLVLQSSYTASLTSKLTVEQLQPTVTDVLELLKNGDRVGYLNDSFMPSLLKRLGFKESKIIAYQSPEEYHVAMSSGSVAAVFDEIPYLKLFLLRHCNKYTMTGPRYKIDGFGFVFPKGSPLVPDVSRAVLKVMEGENMTNFEKELYGDQDCSDSNDNAVTSSSLRFSSFWGLFIITGITSFVALVLYFTFFLHEHRDLLRTQDSDGSVSRKIVSLAKAYDRKDPSQDKKNQESEEERTVVNDTMASPSPCSISGPLSPYSISNHADESYEIEKEVGTSPDGGGSPGREISRQKSRPTFVCRDANIEGLRT